MFPRETYKTTDGDGVVGGGRIPNNDIITRVTMLSNPSSTVPVVNKPRTMT